MAATMPAMARSPAQTDRLIDDAVEADGAIDRAHLRLMTLGDAALEREVLGLFDRQATTMLERLPKAAPEALPALAHALKGSARGIGAWRVAQAAADVEGGNPAMLAALTDAVAEARTAIAKILRAG
jgi:HPt (histidine-containing phosphotransfer) domain-containing protein